MHTSGMQVATIERQGEARLALAFPYAKQRVARAAKAGVKLLSERLSDLLVLPEELKPVSRTGLSSEASDNAGIHAYSTAAKGRLWHKVDITPAREAGRARVSLTESKLAVQVLSDLATYPYQPANYSKNPQSSRRTILRKVRQKWGNVQI